MPQGMELGDATRPVIKQGLPTPLFLPLRHAPSSLVESRTVDGPARLC